MEQVQVQESFPGALIMHGTVVQLSIRATHIAVCLTNRDQKVGEEMGEISSATADCFSLSITMTMHERTGRGTLGVSE